MLTRFIVGAALSLAFSSNALALTGQGKFKKKSQKVSGSWVLAEYEGKQVLAFRKKFDAMTDAQLKLVLSKEKIRKIENNPTFVEPLSIGSIRSNSGDQNYVLPASIELKDYKSLVLYDEAENLIIAGFDIPRERKSNYSSDLRDLNDRFDRDFGGGGGGGS